MSEKDTVHVSAEEARRRREAGEGRTDYEYLHGLSDEEIEKAVQKDPDAPPLLTDEDLERGEWIVPAEETPAAGTERKRVTLEVDRDVVDFSEREGRGDGRANARAAESVRAPPATARSARERRNGRRMSRRKAARGDARRKRVRRRSALWRLAHAASFLDV